MADLAYLKRRWVALVAVVLFAAAAVAASSIFDAVEPFGFEDPDSEVARAYDAYEDATGHQATPGVIALVEPAGGVRGPGARSALLETAVRLSAVDGIAEVEGPAQLGRDAISTDGDAAYLVGFLAAGESDPTKVGERALNQLDGLEGVTVGGPAVAAYELGEQSKEDLRNAEALAAPLLLLLLLLVFRSLLAALLPLAVGAVAIVSTIAAIRGLAEIVDIDLFSINIVTGLGLGLAIDYSLLIVARYREELEHQGPGWDAIHRTLRTAGRTVVFSAMTIAVALAALLVFPQRFLYSIGIGGVVVVIVSAVVALTLLPAMLALLEERVNALAVPGALRRSADRTGSSGWHRWAAFVTRRPLPVATIAAALLIVAGVPFLRVDLTTPDARILPQGRDAKTVDDQLRDRFGAPSTTPIVAVIDGSGAEGNAAVRATSARIAAVPHVEDVIGPKPLGTDARQVSVIADVDPLSDEGQEVLREIRDIEWPAGVLIGGRTAELVDQKQSLESHLPVAIALIAGLTLITLWVVTGSVVLPFVSLLMNVLTVSAAFGILVFVFQDGRLEGLLDYTGQSALDASMPILVGAVVFGLSTDYGIFLLTRIKEARDAGAGNADAIAIGVERTGRIISAAALLFAVALGVFITSELIYVKQTVVGFVTAVLVDATIVRALLLPASMRLLGRATWWTPRALARLHDRVQGGRA